MAPASTNAFRIARTLSDIFPANYLWTLLLHNVLLASLCWMLGIAVKRREWRVNYTRKINHFALMVIPFAIGPFLPYEPSWITITTTLVVFLITTSLFAEPIRGRFSMVQTAFSSVDRPEDRPHTLLWILTQAIAAYAVLVVLFLTFAKLDLHDFIIIPLLVNGIGDGLAEPIGVRFGRHRYRVPSLASGRHYTRSLEGSACVVVMSIVTVMLLHQQMTLPQFALMMIVIPVGLTVAEAFSPHSWDSPFMYAVAGMLIVPIMVMV